MPEWMSELPALLARALTLYRLGELDLVGQLLNEGINGDMMKQYAATCLLARMIAAKAPCDGKHEGECQYQVFAFDPHTGKRREWDDMSKAGLFAVQMVMATLHLDSKASKDLYVQSLKDGCFLDGFIELLARAAETVEDKSKQSITWN